MGLVRLTDQKNIDLDPSWSLTILISKTDERMDGEII